MSRLAGPTYLVIVIVGLAVMWLAMGLLGLAIEVPAKAFMTWLIEKVGPWGPVGFMVAMFGALGVAARASHRRDQRRQFEADRTIHIVPADIEARKATIQFAVIVVVLIAGISGIAIWHNVLRVSGP